MYNNLITAKQLLSVKLYTFSYPLNFLHIFSRVIRKKAALTGFITGVDLYHNL